MIRRLVALPLLGALVFASASARADVDSCVDAADKSQELKDAGQLLEAKATLLACSASSCPAAVAKQCAKWLQEVEQSLPSIVVRVRDGAGKDVSEATITIDGAVRGTQVDGRAIAINPGSHTILVQRAGSADASEKIVVVAGEKNRAIAIESKASVATPPPPEPPKRGSAFQFPWLSGVFFGVGVAAFVGTAILVPVARGQANDLRDTCAPRCAQDDVDAIQAKITAANVLLVVGIATVVAGATVLVLANLLGHKDDRVTAWLKPLTGTLEF